jgi:hypothetical protein
MSFLTHPSVVSPRSARSVAIAALLGTTMLVSPLIAARAGTAADAAPTTVSQQQAGAGATQTKGETVEQRITDLHTALQITPNQEKLWNNVAQAMRENAASMEKLVASDRTTPPQNLTAVEDLQSYQKFAQAHVDGLKNLIGSFGTLYDAMPGPQQKIADGVFNSAGRPRTASHS